MTKIRCAETSAVERHDAQVDAYLHGDGPVPDEWQRYYLDGLKPFEIEWRKSGNPLWIWRALRVALPTPDDCLPPLTAQFPKQHPVKLFQQPHVLPQWITDYLYRVAWDITALSVGEDFRTLGDGAPPHATGCDTLRRGFGPKQRKKQAPTDGCARAAAIRREGRWNERVP